jgi:phosphate-selective porin OprO/OprP
MAERGKHVLVGVLILCVCARVQSEDPPKGEEDWELKFQEMRKELDGLKAFKFSDPSTLRVYFKEGLRIESADKNVKIRIGGRIHADAAFMGQDSNIKTVFGRFEDGFNFRTARLETTGELYQHLEYKAQFDFVGVKDTFTQTIDNDDIDDDGETVTIRFTEREEPQFKDVYVGAFDLAWIGNVRIGHFKEPFGLEQLTSANYITFMERSLINTFTPSRNTGAMVYNVALKELFDGALKDRVTWAAGVFRETDDFGFDQGDGEYAGTFRLTALPWYDDEGKQLLHVGSAFRYANPNGDMVRFSSRPEAGLARTLVDTRNLAADEESRVGAELAAVIEAFSLQGEVMYSHVNGMGGTVDGDFWGGYVMASFFLTGESRPYETRYGSFGRVIPASNFLDSDYGIFGGAWELAARYSYIDLEDGAILGGKLHDITLGLNWYLNPIFRTMFNYVYAHREEIGDAHIFMVRFQAAF